MALRPARVYRKWRRPYTRQSVKSPRRSYVKGVPGSKLNIFEMGDPNIVFDQKVSVVAKAAAQVRNNALEAARVAAGNYVKKNLEEKDFFLKVRVFPHQVLREHAQAAVAQADRFYDGMSHPFGKPGGTAARIKAGQPLLTIFVKKGALGHAKEALRRAKAKLPAKCQIVIE